MHDILDQIAGLFKFKDRVEPQRVSINELVSPEGRPVIIVRDRDGNTVQTIEDHNMVLNIGRNKLVRMLSGDYTGKYLKYIELGKGGTTGDPWTPVEPAKTDIGLTTPLVPAVSKAVSGFDYGTDPVPTQVSFSIIFDSSEVNEIVSEAVLKFSDNSIYAKYTFPSVYLKADKGYSMEIIWMTKFA